MFNAARCNDARRYNAPTSPQGGRMPLVRSGIRPSDPPADSNSAPLHVRKVCLELLGEKDELDRLDSRRRTLNEGVCIWFMISRCTISFVHFRQEKEKF